jgi:hypothetical protein
VTVFSYLEPNISQEAFVHRHPISGYDVVVYDGDNDDSLITATTIKHLYPDIRIYSLSELHVHQDHTDVVHLLADKKIILLHTFIYNPVELTIFSRASELLFLCHEYDLTLEYMKRHRRNQKSSIAYCFINTVTISISTYVWALYLFFNPYLSKDIATPFTCELLDAVPCHQPTLLELLKQPVQWDPHMRCSSVQKLCDHLMSPMLVRRRSNSIF